MIRIVVRIGSRVLVDEVVGDENADIIISVFGRAQPPSTAPPSPPREAGGVEAPRVEAGGPSGGQPEAGGEAFEELERSVEEELEKIDEAVSKHAAKKVMAELLSDFEKQR